MIRFGFASVMAAVLALTSSAMAEELEARPLSSFANERREANKAFRTLCSELDQMSDFAAAAKFTQAFGLLVQKSVPDFHARDYKSAPYLTSLGNIYGTENCAAHNVSVSKTEFDVEIAANYHRWASEFGYPVALSNYGNRLIKGEGVKSDSLLGAWHLTHALMSGYGTAGVYLANYNMDEVFFPRNLEHAETFLDAAARSDEVNSKSLARAQEKLKRLKNQ